jgi:AAA domain/Primase C terminal 2 (PriCT-2)/RepB DNA-primase N-terminal domain
MSDHIDEFADLPPELRTKARDMWYGAQKPNGAHRTEATAEGVDVDARKQAELFLRTLDPTTDRHCFVAIGETPARKGMVRELHGTLAELWPTLCELNKQGDAIYCTANGTDGTGRKAQNINKVRDIWCEDDTGARHSKPLPIEPDLVVETSPGKAHLHIVADDLTPEDHRSAMASMVELYGSDPNAKDLSRILRVPGFLHQKGKPFLVSIVGGRATKPGYARRSADEVRKAFPPLPPKPEPVHYASDVNLAHVAEALRYVTDFDTRQTWLKVGAALHDVDTLEARELWDTWAKQSAKYDAADSDRVWDSFSHERKDGKRVTVGSIFRRALKGGWKPPADWRGDPTSGFGPTADEDLKNDAKPNIFDERSWLFDQTPESELSMEVREWIAKRRLVRGYVTLLIAPGGTGKSLLELQWSAAVALGLGAFTQLDVCERTKVLVLNNEDPRRETQLRMQAIFKHFGLDWAEAHGRIRFFSGYGDPFRMAIKNRDGKIEHGPHVKALIELVKREGYGVICVDPLISTGQGLSENDNGDMEALLSVYRHIAAETNAAVCIVGHTRKLPQGSSEGHAGHIDSGRGASTAKDAARIGLTLYNMSEDDAKKLKVPAHQKHRYVRLDETEKFNLGLARPTAQWFERVSVKLTNAKGQFEWMGVLVPAFRSVDSIEDIEHRILLAINEGKRLSPSKQASNSAAGWIVAQQHGSKDFSEEEAKAAKDAAQTMLDTLEANNVLARGTYVNKGDVCGCYVAGKI